MKMILILQKGFYVYFHGSCWEVEVKGRYYVRMEDTQSTNQIASYMNLCTATVKICGI